MGGNVFSVHEGAFPLMGELGVLSGDEKSSAPMLDAVIAT